MELLSTKTCRVCISKPGDELINNQSGEYKLSEMIMIISKVKIDANDNLPKTICVECSQDIENAFKIKCLIEKTDIKLRKYFSYGESSDIPEVVYIKTEYNDMVLFPTNLKQDSQQIVEDESARPLETLNEDMKYCTNVNRECKNSHEECSETELQNDCQIVADCNSNDKIDSLVQHQNFTNKKYENCDVILLEGITKLKRKKEIKKRLYTPRECYGKRGKYKQKDKPKPERQPSVCDQCGKVFKWPQGLKRHLSIHTGERAFKCYVCSMTFRTDSNLTCHLRIHANDRRYKCKICNKAFFTNLSLRLHTAIHLSNDEKPLKCDYCDKRFHMRMLLNKHRKIHNKILIACQYCESAFRNELYLRRHMKTVHYNIKFINCDICHHKFSNSGNLRVHMQKHTDEKRVECGICCKKFWNKGNLTIHEDAAHKVTEKRYECNVCSKKFSSPNHLKMHLQTHSDRKIPFQCRYCGQIFGHTQALGAHHKEHMKKGDHIMKNQNSK